MIIDKCSKAFNVFLDDQLNDAHGNSEGLISSSSSKIACYVIPTDEEVVIARDTVRLLEL